MANFDLAIVGGGPAGYVAAIRAGQLGMKVVCVERERLGGICLNWGCIPTKVLLRAAEVLETIRRAGEFGIQVGEPKIDFAKVVGRSRAIADKFSGGIEFLFKKYKVERIAGNARLSGRGRLEVVAGGGKERRSVEATNIILATGARAKGLPGLVPDGKNIITSREAMVLKQVPKTMLIVGAGAIGVEFASFYHAMGSEVTLVEALPRIMPLEDEEVAKALERSFVKRGIIIKTGAKIEGAKATEKGVSITVAGEKKTFDVVLLSVGVAPNTEDLGLEALSVEKTERGFIRIGEQFRTSSPGIYAIGDVAGPPLLAHKAMQEALVCVEALAGHHDRRIDYAAIPSCTYCQPEVASLGLTEAAARERGHEIKVGKFPFSALGKAIAYGESEGFVKTIVDATHGEILGVHMIGPHVTDLVAELAAVKAAEGTVAELLSTVHPHPTLSEAVGESIAHALGEAIHI